jgi:predicted Zn finger-like uncharacterized protein
MTMLTRCAACGTAFRVTHGQLAAHAGKVRCGACKEVFDALANLVNAAAPAEVTNLSMPQATSAALVLAHAPAPPEPQPEDVTTPLAPELAGEAAHADDAPVAALEDAAAPAALTAVQPSRERSGFAWWSAAGALLALCVLAIQGAYFYRNELVAHYPESKPWLTQMCAHLACRFDAPRDAQAITIESHDLQTDPANKNVLALVALLRNRARFAQDVPHLELTLTDAQDAALARRVFLPREYVSAAQMAANTELPVRVLLDAGAFKPSGYRLYAFYP